MKEIEGNLNREEIEEINQTIHDIALSLFQREHTEEDKQKARAEIRQLIKRRIELYWAGRRPA